MKLIAHQGLKVPGFPKNTVLAFQRVIDNPNYVGFELDVRTSKDGVFMVYHDLFVEANLLRFLTSSVLRKKYHINTLEEVLKLKTNKIILIEIKEDNINVSSFVALLEKYKDKHIYVDSFDNKVIKKIKEKTNTFPVGVLNYVFNSENSYDSYDFIGLLSPIISSELILYFEKKKIDIFLYGIRKKENLGIYPNVYYITDDIF